LGRAWIFFGPEKFGGIGLNKVIWCERGWQPVYFGFCPSEAAWKREMKRLGAADPYPTTAGRATVLESDGKLCVIVTIAEAAAKTHTWLEVMALLVHEAAHVWQEIRAHIGESAPSPEFEAYAMQCVFLGLAAAYDETRGFRRR